MLAKFFTTVLVLFLMTSTGFGQTYIPSQDEMDDLEEWDGDILTLIPANDPYIFGVDWQGVRQETEFTITSDQTLIIGEGTEIQLADCVCLYIDGTLQVGDREAQHVETIITGWNGDWWGAIVLRGYDVNTGQAEINNTSITHGGNEFVWDDQEIGMITLTNSCPGHNQTSHPSLDMWSSGVGGVLNTCWMMETMLVQ